MLSRFSQNPGPEHTREADHVIAYLSNTKHLGIRYNGSTKLEETIIAASDASFADDETRRSTQGYLIKPFGGPVVWQSNLQRSIVISTTEVR